MLSTSGVTREIWYISIQTMNLAILTMFQRFNNALLFARMLHENNITSSSMECTPLHPTIVCVLRELRMSAIWLLELEEKRLQHRFACTPFQILRKADTFGQEMSQTAGVQAQ